MPKFQDYYPKIEYFEAKFFKDTDMILDSGDQ
jgi:hypothetical protein